MKVKQTAFSFLERGHKRMHHKTRTVPPSHTLGATTHTEPATAESPP